MSDQDLLDRPLSEISDALGAGDVSSRALTEAAIARRAAAHHGAHGLEAYKTWDPERALAQAAAADAARALGRELGRLQGVPVSIKDIYGVTGMPTFAGTPRRLPAKWECEGPVAQALTSQLAVVMGKTHTVEFAMGMLGTNAHWGTPRNPWDATSHRVPGGSSAGAGVSLVEGSALVALGTDTAGSVRGPASSTGTVGLKTSKGRWSTAGIVPLSPTLDTAGVLARTVADLAVAFAEIDPAAAADPAGTARALATLDVAGLRIGIADDFFWNDCSPGVAEAARAAVAELEHAGARTRPTPIPQGPELYAIQRAGSFGASEFSAFVSAELPDWLDTLDPGVRARVTAAQGMTAAVYLGRLRQRRAMIDAAATSFDGVDIVAMPTLPNTPPRLDEIADPAAFSDASVLALRNTSIANLLDMCAITLPVALDDAGMPVGLQLLAPLGADMRLLSAALAVERTLGTGRARLGAAPWLSSGDRP